MKKLLYAPVVSVILATVGISASIQASPRMNLHQSAELSAKWIDPDILRKLQDIKPIDRRKLKPGVTEKIAQDVSSSMSDVSITTNTSKTVIPELTGLKESVVIVVFGKTKYPFSVGSPITGRGTTYPPGLNTEVVYSDSGKLLRDRTTLPVPKVPMVTN